MKYNQERALYYSVLISKIQNKSLASVYSKLKAIFLIEETTLDEIVNNVEYTNIDSYTMATTYLRALACFSTSALFGSCDDIEYEALIIKQKAYNFLQNCLQNVDNKGASNDISVVFAENYSKLNCGVLFSLLLYFSSTKTADNYYQVLKKSLSTNEFIDSATCLLSLFEKDRKYIIPILKQKKLTTFDNFLERLLEYYNENNHKAGV